MYFNKWYYIFCREINILKILKYYNNSNNTSVLTTKNVNNNVTSNLGNVVDEKKLFQYEFSETLWTNIRNYAKNLSLLPLWTNNTLSSTVFGGKQNYQFWQTIFTTGASPQGVKVLAQPINILELQKPI